ncbi:acylphosphatase [Spongiibacter nanhainus]|uniref:acylphosphatase n=1 Tax=Spongiibacter nanhainus TaxID=2794344 RepID=A0A7T4R1T2_9GAMM|nr:acylphosphatase [Spongiibacter nanhainus]
MRAVHLQISGRVQGVGYRHWTVKQARRLGLSGWVRNRPNGSVEAQAWGTDDAVSALIEACHQGPIAARVDAVDVSECRAGDETGFEQRPTD